MDDVTTEETRFPNNYNYVSSPKIAFVATVYSHLNAFHIPYMKLLIDMGVEVHAYANGLQEWSENLRKAGVICHEISFSRNPFHRNNIVALLELINHFKREHFRLVHVHTPVGGILGRIAAHLSGVPGVLYTVHGFHFYKGAPLVRWLLYYPLERMLARWTDVVITMNKEDHLLAKRFAVRGEVVKVPGVGLDLNRYSPSSSDLVDGLRRSLGLNNSDFVLLCVAELIPRKNIPQLLKAVAKLGPNSNVKCLLAGVGSSEAELRLYVKKLNLESRVYFLGFRRDISDLMTLADVVCLLSTQEGLPRVLVEALALGKPIVTTDVRGNMDLVKNGRNGLLVPVGDVVATKDAICKLLKDADLRKRISSWNATDAHEYEISRVLAPLKSIYEGFM